MVSEWDTNSTDEYKTYMYEAKWKSWSKRSEMSKWRLSDHRSVCSTLYMVHKFTTRV